VVEKTESRRIPANTDPLKTDRSAVDQPANQRSVVMSVRRALDEALKRYQQGNLEQAASIVSQLTAAKPRSAEAHNLHGVILAAQGKRAEAAKALGRAVRIDPRNSQYLSNLGEVERQRGKHQQAAAAFNAAIEINPRNPQAQNNLGILHYDRREYAEAVECYKKALSHTKAYPEAHNNLGNALRALGRREEAIDHYQNAVLLREKYPEAYNNMASVLREMGQLPEAEHAYRKAISQRSDYVEAYVNLALLLDGSNRADEALRLLGEALRINQRHSGALVHISRLQLRNMNYEKAAEAARLAIKSDAKSVDAYLTLGQVLTETDQLKQALLAFESVLRIRPGMVEARTLYGVCLKAMGRLDEAREQFRQALDLAPSAAGVYANISDLQKYTPDHPHLHEMRRLLAEAPDPESERVMPLYFALGKAYDDIGEFDLAFDHFQKGAAIKRRKLNYDEIQTLGFLDSIREVFSPDLMRNPPFVGISSEVPVFIVGMPRSGSTLVEQVLSNHPSVFGAGEIKDFTRELNSLRGRFPGLPRFPHMIQKMSAAQYRMLAEGYLRKLTALAPTAARITDKLLTNFYFVGLLHMLYPKAKFVHTLRNPVDTCLSAYSKLFKDDMPHSYDLGELGRHYRKYAQLMDHWQDVLPDGTMKTIVYEEVVNDLPGAARGLIDFLGLPWNEACLAFHESQRPVKTASVVQVRTPVYATSVGRWKRYGKSLQPLIEALDYRE
jgi:tetratricopeptide (TPR) repeat protein